MEITINTAKYRIILIENILNDCRFRYAYDVTQPVTVFTNLYVHLSATLHPAIMNSHFWPRYFNSPTGANTALLGYLFLQYFNFWSIQMFNLRQRHFSEKPALFISPKVSVCKRANVAPRITINNDGKELVVSHAQSKPLAQALLAVAQALEDALRVHQGINGLNLSLEQYRPLAQTLMNTTSSIDAVLGEIQ